MSKYNFECPHKLARITGTRHSGMILCSYTMSLEPCDGTYRYENNNGHTSCDPLGLIVIPKAFDIDEEEKIRRSEIINTVGNGKPPTPDYTLARYLPEHMNVDSVPITIKKLMHGLNNQGNVEWVKK